MLTGNNSLVASQIRHLLDLRRDVSHSHLTTSEFDAMQNKDDNNNNNYQKWTNVKVGNTKLITH